MASSIQKSTALVSIRYSDIKKYNITNITSVGGCVVYEVAKRCSDASFKWQKHYWRRPTIALMSAPVERSKYKLGKIPTEFINYFVNDISKSHLSELDAVGQGGAVIFDITRDLFTGVLDLGGGCYIMNPVDGVGIVDGLTPDTMDLEMIYNILGSRPNVIDYRTQRELFFDLWKIHFQKMMWFFEARFQHVILLEIYFTHEAVFGGSQPSLVEGADAANRILADMYAFARSQGVEIVGLERSAYVTGHFVPWGGPSLTHFVEETLERLADRVVARIDPSLPLSEGFVRQAYRRAETFEQTMIWLNNCKVDLEKHRQEIAALKQESASKDSQTQIEIDSLNEKIRSLHSKGALQLKLEGDIEELKLSLIDRDKQVEAMSGLVDNYKSRAVSLSAQADTLMVQVSDLEARVIDAGEVQLGVEARALEAEKLVAEGELRVLEAERRAADLEVRALESERLATEAERRALEAERKAMEVVGEALEAGRRLGEVEFRALESEGRAAELEKRSEIAEHRLSELERLALELEQRALSAEQRNQELRLGWPKRVKHLIGLTK